MNAVRMYGNRCHLPSWSVLGLVENMLTPGSEFTSSMGCNCTAPLLPHGYTTVHYYRLVSRGFMVTLCFYLFSFLMSRSCDQHWKLIKQQLTASLAQEMGGLTESSFKLSLILSRVTNTIMIMSWKRP